MGAQENSHGDVTDEVKNMNGLIHDNYDDVDKDNKGNEEKKIFCGGISYETTNEDLITYFNQYGEVIQAQVKFDRVTGRSRGFAFVEFATAEACKLALAQREQNIKNKQCEIKPAKTRENNFTNKKIFVGGLPSDFPEEDLRKHFEQYGKIEEIEWPFDKQTKARRNFAFIVFEDEETADRASSTAKQSFGSRECDVKKAVPQNKRNKLVPIGAQIALRGAFGGHGLRGPTMMPNTPAWYNPWTQMSSAGVPTGYGAGNGAPAWADWYGNQAAAAAANFYAHGAATNSAAPTGYGYAMNVNNHQGGWAHKQIAEKMANLAIGIPNGYTDYSGGHQNAAAAASIPGTAAAMQRQAVTAASVHQNGTAAVTVNNNVMPRYTHPY